MACWATASALTPAALARRMPCARNTSLSYQSTPELIDWMSLSRFAAPASSFFHSIETTRTSDVGKLLGEVLRRPHLDVGDAGVAQREALGHAIGRVRKADAKLVPWRKHWRISVPVSGEMVSGEM